MDLAVSNQEHLGRLIKLFTQHDLTGMGDLAHRVKGLARIIGDQVLIEDCEALEVACRGLDSVLLTEAVDRLQQAMYRLDSSLEDYLT
ncbi:hypothetical protein PS865_04482 [Pseudomonas fluorescens]|nr:hypothetical protein PS865_04482 [Pseudomonas fluorescens]